ncbi:hypothetical protein COUCH_26455 [Couchioplanes caeruleus]|uniref:hypothetical protein n=1 Tax=Couchioplanes caeruleus TaxID=56438 RepID=UPI0020C1282C|nr:hypothetical protein [Couchioplanes caeruleus]UQU62558.1 hypothetical protein COUCH_26455 [Couchioplanes caeruleus]
MDLRDALSALTMGVAMLVLAVAAVRSSIQAGRGVAGPQSQLLVASRSSMAAACGLLAASFLLSAFRRLSPVLLILAVLMFVLGFSLERIRARRIKANSAAAADERP